MNSALLIQGSWSTLTIYIYVYSEDTPYIYIVVPVMEAVLTVSMEEKSPASPMTN